MFNQKTLELIRYFDQLCIPTADKCCYLLEKFRSNNAVYQESSSGKRKHDAGIVIPAKTKPNKLIISHIDLIPYFEVGFARRKKFEIVPDQENGLSLIRGGLDNGITNAVLVDLISNNGIPDDVEILFSLGEERGSKGVREFLTTKSKDYFEDLVVINLDVSHDNFGCGGSLEFDYPDPLIVQAIKDQCVNTEFTTMRAGDDTDAVLKFTKAAFSYCLPTDEHCHTYKSNALIENLIEYHSNVSKILYDLNLSYSHIRMAEYVQSLKPVQVPFCQGQLAQGYTETGLAYNMFSPESIEQAECKDNVKQLSLF